MVAVVCRVSFYSLNYSYDLWDYVISIWFTGIGTSQVKLAGWMIANKYRIFFNFFFCELLVVAFRYKQSLHFEIFTNWGVAIIPTTSNISISIKSLSLVMLAAVFAINFFAFLDHFRPYLYKFLFLRSLLLCSNYALIFSEIDGIPIWFIKEWGNHAFQSPFFCYTFSTNRTEYLRSIFSYYLHLLENFI